MIHQTRGIVLKTIRHGETSVIVTIFTELYGVQTFLVKGARTSKSRSPKANLLQPANMLDMIINYRENASLQFISEFNLGYVYKCLTSDMIKANIAIFMAEILLRTLRQPEAHADLFEFTCRILRYLDQEGPPAANMPLFYTLNLTSMLGFRISGRHSSVTPYLDLREGFFVPLIPDHAQFLDSGLSLLLSGLNEATGPDQANAIPLNRDARIKLLYALLDFLKWHLPDFMEMKSPPILHTLMD